jgi:predicted O-methyltransferase YrrM
MPDQEITKYAELHTSAETDLLYRIHRETYVRMPFPRMLSGHLQGRLLSFICQAAKPKTILEIGTFTGYSAICLAEGLADDGLLYSIEINEELEEQLINLFAEAGLNDRIKLLIGNALEVIPEIPGSFDLVFLDADKENYPQYYNMIIDRLNPGGIILADNVLWSGKVLSDAPDSDMETNGIKQFNHMVMHDERVENLLLPFRDGLMMIRKR